MRRDDTTELMIYAANLWPRKFIMPTNDDELAIAQKVWTDVLGDLDSELVRAAMLSWEDHWPPSPQELRDASIRVRNAGTDDEIPGSDEAWIEFKTEYKNHYSNSNDDEWSHPCVADAARAVGCRDFGQSLETDRATWRAQFRGFYEAAVKRFNRTSESVAPGIVAYRQRMIAARMPELENPDD